MPTTSTPKPLPYPADEIRASALECLTTLSSDLSRLQLFFRGHQRSTTVLDSIALRILGIEMSLHHLQWDSTQAEPTFVNPPNETVRPPPPTPEP